MPKAYPHDLEMEKSVIGQVLSDPEKYEEASKHIHSPSMFYSQDHRTIWRTMTSLRNNDREIDIMTLCAELPASKRDDIRYYLTGLLDDVYTTGNLNAHANEIVDKWLLRECVRASVKIKDSIDDPAYKGINAIRDIQERFDSILRSRPSGGFDISNLIASTTENVMSGGSNVIKFGLGALDNLTGGMTRGEISVVAGRPGQFKTTLIINMVSLLSGNGHRVLVFNREMTNEEMMKKLFVIESKSLTYSRIRTNMSESDLKEWEGMTSRLTKKYKNLIMYDNIMDLDGTLAEIKRIKPDVVIDDYIGLINVRGCEDDRKVAIDTVMRKYKWTAKTLDLCVIAVSQLNRKIEMRQSGRPVLSDLRDSGSIEQDAEMVMFTHYPYAKNPTDELASKNSVELILGKNRYGNLGSVHVGILGDRCKFYETPEMATTDAISQGLIGV